MPYADIENRAANFKAYAATAEGRAALTRANRAYRQRNKLKRAAHNAVSKAVAKGSLQAWPVCAVPTCSEGPTEAHHADYDNPLGVTWLCQGCHKQVHREAKQLLRAT